MKYFFKAIQYQAYLLQLENYELLRFWKLLYKKGLLFPASPLRKKIVMTKKVLAVMLLAEALVLAMLVWFGTYLFQQVLENKAAVAVLCLGVFWLVQAAGFIFLSLAVILLWPLDFLIKKLLVFRAHHKMSGLPELRVIGIAGSYGKTTMKEVLLSVLGTRFKVAATPESVNTPVGIARWALAKIDSSVNIAILEMGEHYRGDVEEVCAIAKPGIAVVAGINEAHLERMKTLENITDTVFEIVSQSKPGAIVLMNADDERVMENYKKYIWPDHKIETFKLQDLSNRNFNTEALQWEAEVENLGQIKISLLGEYALGDVSAAVKIAKSLGMSPAEIKKGVEKIKPIEHRLQPIKSAGGVLVIDDAYNGNSTGVSQAIKTLSRFKQKRKIYITPGLVETGKQAVEVHKKIGQELASAVDLVILIKNSVTPFIAEGLKVAGFPTDKIIWFNTALEAHENLKNVLKSGDVILFQNDWGDQYI